MNRTRLTNARIIDVETGVCMPIGTEILIQDERILAMPGLPGQPADTGEAASIDMGGRTLIPGLFNCHCHLHVGPYGSTATHQIEKNLSDCIDRGVTNIRDALCYDLRESRKWSDRIDRGEIPGPRIHQAVHVAPVGGTYSPIRRPKSLVPMSTIGLRPIDYALPYSGVIGVRPDADAMEIRDAVNRAVSERGARTIKLCDQPEHFVSYKPGAAVFSAAQFEVAADQARLCGVPSTVHNVTARGFRDCVRAGVTSLAHLPFDAPIGDDDIAAFMAGRTFIEPTMTLAYFLCYHLRGSRYCGAPEIDRLDELRRDTYEKVIAESWLPEFRGFRMALHRRLSSGRMALLGIFDISRPFDYYCGIAVTGAANLRRLVDAGATPRMACGNDAGATNNGPAAVGFELRMLDFMLNDATGRDGTGSMPVAPRLSPADLLQIATITSARSLGLDDRFGALKPGRVADIAVIDGDPLTDFKLIGAPVAALFKDGRLVVNRCGL